jgi:uncharacterized membrane protein HdeD (DUF308 family)
MSTTDPRARPAATQYGPSEVGYRDDTAGDGWVLFAGVMLAMLGTLNFIDGIAAVSNSKFFANDVTYILSNLNTWGWVMIIMGIVQLVTALGVWAKTTGARWVGVTIAALNAIAQMFFIPAYPFWSLTLFTLDILVIYGLIAHGSRTSSVG